MWGTCAEMEVQVVPQGNVIVLLAMVKTVAGFWALARKTQHPPSKSKIIFLISN